MAGTRAGTPFIPTTFEELTPEFLTRVLRESGALQAGEVRDCRTELIGSGVGFASDIARLHLCYSAGSEEGPATLIAKLPSGIRKNRAVVEALQGYELRPPGQRVFNRFPVWLFRLLIPLGRLLQLASRRRYLVLVEDLAPARNGNQVAGCTLEEARQAVRGLAAFHASYWADESLEAKIWLTVVNTLPRALMAVHRASRRRFFRTHGDALPSQMREACGWMDRHFEAVVDHLAGPPYTVLHGDYRLDNLFFCGDELWAIDFQIVTRGRPGLDLAHFAAGSVNAEIDFDPLLDVYCEALASRGVEGYDRAQCERDYTLALLFQTYLHTASDDAMELGQERGPRLAEVMRQRLFARMPKPPYDDLI